MATPIIYGNHLVVYTLSAVNGRLVAGEVVHIVSFVLQQFRKAF